jgi:hypothetical protein
MEPTNIKTLHLNVICDVHNARDSNFLRQASFQKCRLFTSKAEHLTGSKYTAPPYPSGFMYTRNILSYVPAGLIHTQNIVCFTVKWPEIKGRKEVTHR